LAVENVKLTQKVQTVGGIIPEIAQKDPKC